MNSLQGSYNYILLQIFLSKGFSFDKNLLREISNYAIFDPKNSNIVEAARANQEEAVIYYLTACNGEDMIEDDEDSDELPTMLFPILTRQNATIGSPAERALDIAEENGYEEVVEAIRSRLPKKN